MFQTKCTMLAIKQTRNDGGEPVIWGFREMSSRSTSDTKRY